MVVVVYGQRLVVVYTVCVMEVVPLIGAEEVFVHPPTHELQSWLARQVSKHESQPYVIVAVDVEVRVIVITEEPD
jgi:hypothetical protein